MPARPYTPPNSCIKYRSLDVCIIEYRSLKVFPNLGGGCSWWTWHWRRWRWCRRSSVENCRCIKYRLPGPWRHGADTRDISIESSDKERERKTQFPRSGIENGDPRILPFFFCSSVKSHRAPLRHHHQQVHHHHRENQHHHHGDHQCHWIRERNSLELGRRLLGMWTQRRV